MAVHLKSLAASASAEILGTARHAAAGVAGVSAEVRGENPQVDLTVRTGVVRHMGFSPLEVPFPTLTADAASAHAGFQWHGRVDVPFALTVRAAAQVTLEAIAKQTQNEGRVSLTKTAVEATE